MPSYKTVFGSWLKTEDLQGRAVTVTVESVSPENVKDNDTGVMEKKLVMTFAGKDKRLILNLTNCETLEQLTGSADYEHWPGAVVTLFPTTTKFGNKTVPCLRIRSAHATVPASQPYVPPPPPPPPPAAEMITDDDIPF